MIDEKRIPILEFVFSYVYKKIKDFIRINYVAKKHETKYKLSDTIFFIFIFTRPKTIKIQNNSRTSILKVRGNKTCPKRGDFSDTFFYILN